MVDFLTRCDWGRAWPSRSRTQGAAFAGGKGKPEDAEMRSARRVIQACLVVGSIIYVQDKGSEHQPQDPPRRGRLPHARRVRAAQRLLDGLAGAARQLATG